MWDLSSPTRDRTSALGSESLQPNHWTTRESPGLVFWRNLLTLTTTSPGFLLFICLFLIYFFWGGVRGVAVTHSLRDLNSPSRD